MLLLTVTLGNSTFSPPNFIASHVLGGCYIRRANLERSLLPQVNLTAVDLHATAFPALYQVAISVRHPENEAFLWT